MGWVGLHMWFGLHMWARLGSPWVGSIGYTENGESYLLCPSIAVVSAQRWRMVVWGADLAVGLCFGGRRRSSMV